MYIIYLHGIFFRTSLEFFEQEEFLIWCVCVATKQVPLESQTIHSGQDTIHLPCIYHASTMHLLCIYHASTMHLPYIYHASTMHLPYIYHIYIYIQYYALIYHTSFINRPYIDPKRSCFPSKHDQSARPKDESVVRKVSLETKSMMLRPFVQSPSSPFVQRVGYGLGESSWM